MEKKADYLFEVSWEICNKVGGIYTVVRSKAVEMLDYYNEKYFAVGPYFIKKATGEFQEEVPNERFKRIFDKLAEEGIVCHYGKWLINGKPNTILIDFTGFTAQKDGIKKYLWDEFKIDSLNSANDYDEPVIWAFAVGKLLCELQKIFKKRIVAHFHEWLSASGLLYIKRSECDIATVFTTHATILGRTIASTETVDLYSVIEKINPEEEAYKYGIHTKYQTERAAAQNADVFTTVSEITALETEHLLGRKPDVLLFNGLNLDKFPTLEDISIKHLTYKNKIREFLLYYFFPYYSFNLNDTYIFFIAGRYEFHDKGIDVLIKALARLNEQLKKEKSKKTVVTFFFVPGNIRGIKAELLQNRRNFNDIKDSIVDSLPDIKNRLIYSIVSKEKIKEEKLFDEDVLEGIKRKILKLAREGKPSLSTHDLYDEENDPILNFFREYNLNNDKNDKVKVVYYSIYLTGADGLLDTGYYDSMLGSQLGIFPSYYEPWGYTPLEAAALGVASVTTDLAGFGRFICAECKQGKTPGVYVLKRFGIDEEKTAEDLKNLMHRYLHLSKEERIRNKIEAKKTASMADWKNFIKYYIEAHNLAFQRKWS